MSAPGVHEFRDEQDSLISRAEAPQPFALQLSGLCKQFSDKLVMDHAELCVPDRCVFGLVGPAGAGKTTLWSMSVGLLPPDQGDVRIFGMDMWSEPARAKAVLGALPDEPSIPDHWTGRDWLTSVAMWNGLDPVKLAVRAEQLLGLWDLTEAETTLVREYSTSLRKKMGLVVALLPSPRLLMLDDPFVGVDAESAEMMQEMLRSYVDDGGTVVLSTEAEDLAEEACDDAAVIVDGRLFPGRC
ncbi:ABC transporter ATP-binding protein [Nocardiopsis gilva YIM 90087]|uniref:ABC transporter ATP-binding protein n=1 Tax=Nocardiopsis gilva YIM 90087 TaxID=1235441 RepID=A0A223SB40_9ACTN|nr:ABC transporter ATP-binding protein [Nocardiopsis gilva YIM 90087]